MNTTSRTATARITLACILLGVLGILASAPAVAEDRVFELRTYVTLEGRLDALNTRFRDHTLRLFKKHGMTVMGFWEPTEPEKGKGNTLIYMLAFPSEDARNEAWRAFAQDPEWTKVAADSQKDGKILERVDSVLLAPTDYSSVR